LVSIQAADPYELKLANSEQLTRLSVRDLSPTESELFAVPTDGLLFADDAGAAELEIAIKTREANSSNTSTSESAPTSPAANKEDLPSIRVKKFHLQSWYEAQGRAVHLASYEVQNAGGGRLRIELPKHVSAGDVRGALADGKPVVWQQETAPAATGVSEAANIVSIPISADQESLTVSINFITHESGLGTSGFLVTPLPRLEALMPAGTWTVCLPPGFETIEGTETKPSSIIDGPAGMQTADTKGWFVRDIQLTAAQPASVKYYHHYYRRCWTAVTILLALGLLMIVRHRYKKRHIAVTPGQGPSDKSSSDGKILPAAGKSGAALLIVAAVFFFSKAVRAEETALKPKTVAPFDYRVFIPIDSAKKPTGDKVYLPEKFYNELYRRAAAAKEEPQGWLLGSAVYRGTLARDAAAGRLAVEAIKAQFDMDVFSRMVQVRIPFHKENAQLISDSVTLDGRPVQAQWEPDGTALRFEVDEPGKYRLELVFRPTSHNLGASAGFEMSIPRLAQSRLELDLPAEVPGIEATTAVGAVRIETDPARLSAELGPCDRLAVHWPATPAAGAAETGIEVDQFTWLKVQPGSVVVNARLKFHVPENQVRRIQLAVDPRLRLLPLTGKDAPSVEIRSRDAKQQIITLQWSRPLAETSAADISFLLTGATGAGKFRLPQIEILGAQKIRRWMALSVDPILEYESQRSPDLESATAADFLKNWGPANSPPLQAYRLVGDKTDWSLSTRPREPKTSARQTLDLCFDKNNVETFFDAQLTVASGYVFQYQLSAPETMKILEASVRREDAELAARWAQDRDGTVTVFLTGPADGEQHLALHGIMPLESKDKTPLPNIMLKRCRVQSTEVQLFRRGEVDLELAAPDNSSSPLSLGEGQGEGIPNRGILLKTLRSEGDAPVQGAVRVTPKGK
jgi:hypothetical protein